MKNIVLSFLAQRLDNQDPTHMELNQRPLAEGNVAERQELARQISEVSLDGSQVFYEESHAAFLLDDKFLLETPSDQLDDAGRIAPIVCYGRVPEPLPASWSGDVVKSVVGFAERIGRTISPKSQEIAGRGVDAILAEAEKKQDARNGKGAVGGRSLADHLRLSRGQVHHRDNATQKTSEESAVGSGAIGDRTSGAWDDLQNPFQIMRRKLKKRRHHSEPRPEPTHPTILRRHNMTDSTWPNEPQCRKTVLVLNQQDIDALRFEEGGADLLLNEQVYILPSSLKESNSVVQDLIDSGLVQPGAVLIQSPFDKNIYENSIQAVERFALAKYLHFSTLCMNLGAREVTVEQIELKNTEDRKIVSLQGGLSMKGTGDIKIEDKEVASFYDKLTLHDKFQGDPPDVQAAEEYLKRTGLSGDDAMRALIDLRRNPNNLLEVVS